MRHSLKSIFLVVSLVGAAPASAQITHRDATDKPETGANFVLIANPHIVGADTLSAVAIGTNMRTHLAAIISKSDWWIIPQKGMNDMLDQWKIGTDKILSPAQVLPFAIALNATVFVTSELSKGKDGSWTLQARVIGRGSHGTAGQVFTLTQPGGPKFADLGSKMAETVLPAFKAFNTAKKCYDVTDPAKQAAYAADAIKMVPNYGMATRCLADIAWGKDDASDSAIVRMKRVLVGDPLSLDTYQKLAKSYFDLVQNTKKGEDSAKVIETYQTMMRLAPKDRDLFLTAFKVFKAFGHPNAADAIVKEMLAADPASQDALDLGSNSEIAKDTKEGYLQAMAYLELYFRIDSTKADSNFYSKIIYSAMNIPDTAKFALWAQRGVEKYPKNAEMLQRIGYVALGRKDYEGTIKAFQDVVRVNPDFGPDDRRLLLSVEQAYLESDQIDKAVALVQIAKKSGSTTLLEDASNLILQAAQTKFKAANTAQSDPKLWAATTTLGDAYLALGTGDARNESLAALFSMYGNSQLLNPISAALQADSKSCSNLLAAKKQVDKVEALRAKAATSALPKENSDQVIAQLKQFTDFLPGAIKDNNCGG